MTKSFLSQFQSARVCVRVLVKEPGGNDLVPKSLNKNSEECLTSLRVHQRFSQTKKSLQSSVEGLEVLS